MLILGIIAVTFMAALISLPLTFFGTIFLGNLRIYLGFFELFPGVMVIVLLPCLIYLLIIMISGIE